MWIETKVLLFSEKNASLGLDDTSILAKGYLDLSKVTFVREVLLEQDQLNDADFCCVTLLDAQEYIIKLPYHIVIEMLNHEAATNTNSVSNTKL